MLYYWLIWLFHFLYFHSRSIYGHAKSAWSVGLLLLLSQLHEVWTPHSNLYIDMLVSFVITFVGMANRSGLEVYGTCWAGTQINWQSKFQQTFYYNMNKKEKKKCFCWLFVYLTK